MNNLVIQYYRCPERYIRVAAREGLSTNSGYFRLGEDSICYGRCYGHLPAATPQGSLFDTSSTTTVENGTVTLPFNFEEVINNLRYELYSSPANGKSKFLASSINWLYYQLRPFLSVDFRKHLQRLRLTGWNKLAFPHWPVDRTVDNLFEQVLLLSLRAQNVDRIPFVWFWPKGTRSCAIVTHDVETSEGRDYSSQLMDIDDSFGIKASFQVVPESRYQVTPDYLESITKRGFEINVQDLNHDGQLYRDQEGFLVRAKLINSYGRKWGAEGFRSAVLYRRQEWFDTLNFSYEMSVPNVAHLDPQRGGCCTVMPYFVGKLLELPVTTTQDYSLFHILKCHSIDLWKHQIELIQEKHGLISVIVHPDYIRTTEESQTYKTLLAHLVSLRENEGLWISTPNEVNRWWRQRAQMSIVENGQNPRIEGPGKERACIAYASEKNGRIVYNMDDKDKDGERLSLTISSDWLAKAVQSK